MRRAHAVGQERFLPTLRLLRLEPKCVAPYARCSWPRMLHKYQTASRDCAHASGSKMSRQFSAVAMRLCLDTDWMQNMPEGNPQTDRDVVGTLVTVGVVALFVFTAIIFAFSFLIFEAVRDSTKCAGKALVDGYLDGSIRGLFVPALQSLVFALIVMIFSRPKWRRQTLAYRHRTILNIASVRVTTGMLFLYGGLVLSVGVFAYRTWLSWTHYRGVATYCLQARAEQVDDRKTEATHLHAIGSRAYGERATILGAST
jgi:hypothetical protein